MKNTTISTADVMNALAELKGIEVSTQGTWIWAAGNTKEHKETLKSLGFRWSRKRGAWYHTGHVIEGQEKAAKGTTGGEMIEPGPEYDTESIDGYMGGGGFKGTKEHVPFYDLPKVLRADFKKHNIKGVTVSKQHASSILFKITPTIADYINFETFLEGYEVKRYGGGYSGYYDYEGDGTWHEVNLDDYFYSNDQAKKAEIKRKIALSEYKRMQEGETLNEHHIDDYKMFTPQFLKKLHYIRKIELADNYDESNSMVDCFCRNFYEDYYIMPVKA